jgi:ribosome-associated heat shock protein Hsp15
MRGVETTRVDRWLWAVRAHKTRSLATDGCRAGHVTVNGQTAKAATMVKPGDRVEARVGDRKRDLEVVTVIEKRVSAAVAATCFVDHTPPPPEPSEFDAPLFKRDARTGRPTKRDRRDLERFKRGQDDPD